MRRPLLLFLVLLLAGCRSTRAPLEPLPIAIYSRDAKALSVLPLEPVDLAARAGRCVLYVEQDEQIVKPFRDYAHDVGVSFVTMLAQPLTAPLFLFDLLFGWLDFSTTWGTGFIVDPVGHVVTNAHVVGESEEMTVARADGVKGRAKVIAVDEGRDLALLEIKMGAGASLCPEEIAPLGTSSAVRLGEKVVIYGFPRRPWEQDQPVPTVTHGIVSSLKIDVGEEALRIQSDAAANGGASGSPVLDEHGAVIGVVTEAADPSAFEGQTFAIPVDDVVKAFFEREGKKAPRAGATGGSTADREEQHGNRH